MKAVLFIVLYLLIGILLGLAPAVINKGIFKYSNFYEYHDESSWHYEFDIEDNAVSFAFITFLWPILIFVGLVSWLFYSISKAIMKLHKKTKKR